MDILNVDLSHLSRGEIVDLVIGLRSENARLRAEIDADNAQEPIYQAQTIGGFWSDVTAENYAKHAIWRIVYARPIPAQQSPYFLTEYVAPIDPKDFGAIPDKKQEPAVVVPETISDQLENFICYLIDKEEGAIIAEETLHHQLAAFLSNEKYNKQSPRITEQDAREIIRSYMKFDNAIGSCATSSDFIESTEGRALLDKLNKV